MAKNGYTGTNNISNGYHNDENDKIENSNNNNNNNNNNSNINNIWQRWFRPLKRLWNLDRISDDNSHNTSIGGSEGERESLLYRNNYVSTTSNTNNTPWIKDVGVATAPSSSGGGIQKSISSSPSNTTTVSTIGATGTATIGGGGERRSRGTIREE